MFDIGWSELLVIAVVAIVVVGPKDLPRMLRAFGRTMGQVRRTANDFRRQFDEALREAEREADLADTRKTLQSIGRIDPLADVKKELTAMSAAASATPGVAQKPAEPEAHAEPPAKTGALPATGAASGSDAA